MTKQCHICEKPFHHQRRQRTGRERFLQIMDNIVPWNEWVEYIRPYLPPGWETPHETETLLRVYLLQTWFNIPSALLRDSITDSYAMRSFTGGLHKDLPDAQTLAVFRRLLESHRISEKLSGAINRTLRRGGATLRGGSIMEAAIIRNPGREPGMTDQKH